MRTLPSARIVALAATLLALPAAAQQRTLPLDSAHVQALQTRVDAWAGELPPAERILWADLLRRAAAAPAAQGEVRVAPVLQIGPGGGCDSPAMREDARRAGIVVAGDRGAASRAGIIIQGGLTARPRVGGTPAAQPVAGSARPGVAAARIPRPTGSCTVAIGPKQDDPAPPPQSLGARLAVLGGQLSEEERGALNWLLTRAIQAPGGGRPGTPEDPRPTGDVSLRAALGIGVAAIGPKQDDPAPPPPSRWILRY